MKQRRPDDVTAFVSDTMLQDAVAMGVLVAVQEALDIALHISADEGWRLASSAREAFVVLADHGVVPVSLAEALAAAAQLRNRIAHGYGTLDPARLHAELPDGMAALAAFSTAISAFLASDQK